MAAVINDKPSLDGPTRPTKPTHPTQAIQDRADMVSVNSDANDRFKRNSEALQQRQAEKRDERDQPAPNDKDKAQGATQEAPAKEQPAAQAQPRTLTFAEDRDRSSRNYADLKREQATAAPAKGEGRTLTFAEDRSKGHGHDGR